MSATHQNNTYRYRKITRTSRHGVVVYEVECVDCSAVNSMAVDTRNGEVAGDLDREGCINCGARLPQHRDGYTAMEVTEF